MKHPGRPKVVLSNSAQKFADNFNYIRSNNPEYNNLTEKEKTLITIYNSRRPNNWLSKSKLASTFNLNKFYIDCLFNKCRSDLYRFMSNKNNQLYLQSLLRSDQANTTVLATACNLPKYQINDWIRLHFPIYAN